MTRIVASVAINLTGNTSNNVNIFYDDYSILIETSTDMAARYTLGGVPVMDVAANGRFVTTSYGGFYGSLSAMSIRLPNGQSLIELGGINQNFSSLSDFSRLMSASEILSRADTIVGSAYADTLYGWAGNDAVFGGDGSDTLDGGSGSDVIDGGTGIDLAIAGVSYNSDRAVRYNGQAVVMDGYGTVDRYTNVEYLQFTNGTLATSVMPAFNSLSYIASYPDLIAAYGLNGESGFNHYVQWGYAAGRRPGGFNALSYLASHPDLVAAYGIDEQAATVHYIQWGKAAGWGITFNPLSYIKANPDVAAAVKGNLTAATINYILWGRAAGRPTASANAAPIELQAAASHVVAEDLSSPAAVAVAVAPESFAPIPVAAETSWADEWGVSGGLATGMAATDTLLVPLSTDAWSNGAFSVANFATP